MSDKRTRRHFSAQEKVAILKRHLVDKVVVSALCNECDIYPTQFYGWLKDFFEHGHLAFENGRKSKAVEDANLRKSSSSKPSCNAETRSWPNSWKSTPF